MSVAALFYCDGGFSRRGCLQVFISTLGERMTHPQMIESLRGLNCTSLCDSVSFFVMYVSFSKDEAITVSGKVSMTEHSVSPTLSSFLKKCKIESISITHKNQSFQPPPLFCNNLFKHSGLWLRFLLSSDFTDFILLLTYLFFIAPSTASDFLEQPK